MKIYLISFLSFCSVLYSCIGDKRNSNNEIIICAFPREVDIDLMAPRKIFASSTGFFVFDTSKKNNFLMLYSNKGDSLDSFGRIGNGPGELMMPICNQSNDQLIISSIGGELYFVSDVGGKIKIDQEIKDNSNILEGSNYITRVDTSVYLLSKTAEDQIQIHDFQSGVSCKNNFYPFAVSEGLPRYMVNNVLFESNYSYGNGHLFICYKYYPLASIVDITEKAILQTIEVGSVVKNNYSVNNGVVEFDDPTLFYTFSSYANQSFWALYQNSKRIDLKDNAQRSQIHRISLGMDVPVVYQLDRSIYNFTVSPDGKAIYALYYDKDSEPKVCIYDI